MPINKDTLLRMLEATADLLKEESPKLNQLDAQYGNGNHGDKVSKIADTIQQEAGSFKNDQNASLKEFLSALGNSIRGTDAGPAGSLIASMISGLAQPLSNQSEIDPGTLKEMIAKGTEAVKSQTEAREGDKTLMDALLPAASASQKAPNDIAQILLSAAGAALSGATSTGGMPSKYGRAREHQGQTIGTPDPGAASMAAIFNGLASIFRSGQ